MKRRVNRYAGTNEQGAEGDEISGQESYEDI